MELNLNNQVENGQDHTSEFKEIVEQSREAIHTEMSDQSGVKRKRGRPRKPDSEKAAKNRSAAGPASSETTATTGNVQESAPDLSQHLVLPIIYVSKLPAQKYKIPELAFTPDEAYLCAQSLNNCLQVFAPSLSQMSPKTAAVLGVCMAFGTVGFSKVQIYMEKKAKDVTPATEPTAQEKANVEQRENPVDAGNFFRKSAA